MILQNFLLKDFSEGKTAKSTVVYPQGSIFLKLQIKPQGIFAYYAVPTLLPEPVQLEEDSFVIIGSGEEIPGGSQFVDMLSVVTEGEEDGQQAMVVFTIFKLSK